MSKMCKIKYLDADSFALLCRIMKFYFKYMNDELLDDFDSYIIDILDEYSYLIENERSN